MFMWLMHDLMWPFLDDFILVHLDDILIFSTSWEEDMMHIKVLEVLERH